MCDLSSLVPVRFRNRKNSACVLCLHLLLHNPLTPGQAGVSRERRNDRGKSLSMQTQSATVPLKELGYFVCVALFK